MGACLKGTLMSAYDDLKRGGGKVCFEREAARIFEALGVPDGKWKEEVGNAPRSLGEQPPQGGFSENQREWACCYRVTRNSGKKPLVEMKVHKLSGGGVPAGSIEFMVVVAGVAEGGMLKPGGNFDAFVLDVATALNKLAP